MPAGRGQGARPLWQTAPAPGGVIDVSVWQFLDAFGVFVFALSGALAAARLRLDAFGYLVLAFLPAVGGGTIRYAACAWHRHHAPRY